jgi:hypothetical protein
MGPYGRNIVCGLKVEGQKETQCIYYNEDKTPPLPEYQHTEQRHNKKEERERIRPDGNILAKPVIQIATFRAVYYVIPPTVPSSR